MNQLVESIDSEGEEKYYYYDTWGNLISDGIAQYYYDHLNRLKEYRQFGVVDGTHYSYYIDNLRKSKDDTYFIWLDGNMVYEFSRSDSSTYTYGIHLATSDDYTYVLNAHGDVAALISTTDEVVKRYEYDSYGNELNIDQTDTNPFRYCGEYYDRETGQIYLRARYYQPIVGRFTQRDTHWNTANMIYGDDPRTKEYEDYLGLNDYTVKLIDYAAIRQSGNLYGYCLNNPITYTDKYGNSLVVAMIISGVVSATFNIIEQSVSTGSIDWIEVAISGAGGALGGLIGGAGFSLGTQIALGALNAGITEFSVQRWRGDVDGAKIAQSMASSIISDRLGLLSSPNNAHLNTMTDKFIKRVGNVLNGQTFNSVDMFSAAGKEIAAAYKYYFSQASYDAKKWIWSEILEEIPWLLELGYDMAWGE